VDGQRSHEGRDGDVGEEGQEVARRRDLVRVGGRELEPVVGDERADRHRCRVDHAERARGRDDRGDQHHAEDDGDGVGPGRGEDDRDHRERCEPRGEAQRDASAQWQPSNAL